MTVSGSSDMVDEALNPVVGVRQRYRKVGMPLNSALFQQGVSIWASHDVADDVSKLEPAHSAEFKLIVRDESDENPGQGDSLTGAPCEMNRLRAIQTHTQIQADAASGVKSHSLMGRRQSRSSLVNVSGHSREGPRNYRSQTKMPMAMAKRKT